MIWIFLFVAVVSLFQLVIDYYHRDSKTFIRPQKHQLSMPDFRVYTGLGQAFDDLATLDRLAEERAPFPYHRRFENRKILDIYGIQYKRTGREDGKEFLYMIARNAPTMADKIKIETFLDAIGRIDDPEYHELSPIVKKRVLRRKMARQKGLVASRILSAAIGLKTARAIS